MDRCANHDDHIAIESCEICDRPLCALCLWYSDDGLRLCEEHAHERREQGQVVYPPTTYADALRNKLVRPDGANDSPEATYQANRQDVNALVSAVMAVTAIFSCCGGVYCLPIVALVMGALAYAGADRAFDPSRTRRLAGVGLGAGALMLITVFGCVMLYAILLIVALASSPGP